MVISLIFFIKKSLFLFCKNETFPYICNAFKSNAQMAELVDALVSNTSEATRAGSIPALGTAKILLRNQEDFFVLFFLITSTEN